MAALIPWHVRTGKHLLPAILALTAFGGGVLVGRDGGPTSARASEAAASATDSASATEVHEPGHPFIGPLLDCSTHRAPSFEEFEGTLRGVTEAAVAESRVDTVAVYFRDLMSGAWVGIDEDVEYDIASMAKVVVLMATLRQAEKDPKVLLEKLPIDARGRYASQNIPPTHQLSPGEYSVKDLLEQMIVYSDNVAALELADRLRQGELSATMNVFGFTERRSGTLASPKAYSGIFRVLFNTSYLSRERSMFALELLSRSEFKDGLVAGVPAGTSIAHKFGERRYAGRSEVQLHDCGIVYHPTRPYFICIMTRGKEFPALASVIQEISRAAHERVEQGFSPGPVPSTL